MTTRRDTRVLKIGLLAAGAGLVTAAALLMAIAVDAPGSGLAGAVARLLPVAEAPAAEAEAALVARRLPDAATATRRELAITPNRTEPWLRLAFVETAQAGGHLNVNAKAALARSYQISRYDLQNGVWRIRFIADHWSDAPVSLRILALDEVEALWFMPQRDAIATLPRTVSDTEARYALGLKIATLKRHTTEVRPGEVPKVRP